MALTLFMTRGDNALLSHDQLLILTGRGRGEMAVERKWGGRGCGRDEGATGWAMKGVTMRSSKS